MARAPLTFRRLTGLDRSGPPPPETLSDRPWNPWTIPNAIGFVRAVLIPVFVVLAYSSESGTDALPAILFALIAWGDYADGMAARITGQYSRLGALLDPIVDRALVVAGIVVCWDFELLPRWALALLVAREGIMLTGGRYLMKREVEMRINWFGRWAVWPTMGALFFGLVDLRTTAEIMLYAGLVLSYLAVVGYVRNARRQLSEREAGRSSVQPSS